jgi:hypothetical protein
MISMSPVLNDATEPSLVGQRARSSTARLYGSKGRNGVNNLIPDRSRSPIVLVLELALVLELSQLQQPKTRISPIRVPCLNTSTPQHSHRQRLRLVFSFVFHHRFLDRRTGGLGRECP